MARKKICKYCHKLVDEDHVCHKKSNERYNKYKSDELEKIPVISVFQLHQCMPISVNYDNNTIEISMDYIELNNIDEFYYFSHNVLHQI